MALAELERKDTQSAKVNQKLAKHQCLEGRSEGNSKEIPKKNRGETAQTSYYGEAWKLKVAEDPSVFGKRPYGLKSQVEMSSKSR